MINRKIIKNSIMQIIAITRKNIKLKIRWKLALLFEFITPIFMILMPLIIMSKFFVYNESFGSWNQQNLILFQFIAYNINLLIDIIREFPAEFRSEKYWKTLPALIIAPFSRYNLLLGIYFAHILIIAIPFTFFFILCYIIYPINFWTIIFIIILFLLIAIIFSGMGLIIGIFAISVERYLNLIVFFVNLTFWASTLTYPFELFPILIQQIINLNPFYYMFELLRLSWIENDIIYTISTNALNFFVLILFAILLPSFGVYIFNFFYKKYGIVGY